ncbi:MAG TPA: oligopeptide/dipeptide ABC transporter ATP-binding protein [Casimicrobiaceae bacterium]|nr:oligopeptide/dipeptide ABC transporter ATP-binding protein [Casimicrobiaceae bacterium]
MTDAVLEVHDLFKHYSAGRAGLRLQIVHALEGVSLSIRTGETHALVGESGCGKSTLARCIMRLEPATRGTILIAGRDITHLRGPGLRDVHKRVQIVFQDPYSSLNPRRTIAKTIADPLRLYAIGERKGRRARAEALLRRVGLGAAFLDRLPRDLSGGQRQRVAIARALAVEPQVLICDEPVSALDVSVQAQVINLLKRLQRELGIAYLFISHNLGLVQQIADRISVMYLGRIVELADAAALRQRPMHPYTEALFSAMPVVDPDAAGSRKRRIVLSGEVPSAIGLPSGCAFAPRCRYRQEICDREPPPFKEIEGRRVRCHFAGELPIGAAG